MDEDQVDEVATEPSEASGSTPDAAADARVRLHTIGCPDRAVERLRQAGADIVETVGPDTTVVVSTRADADAVPDPLPSGTTVLVHPGGDGRAVALLTAGATALFAEGDERSLVDAVAAATETAPGDAQNAGAETIVVLRVGRMVQGSSNVTSLVRRRLLTRWRSLTETVGATMVETDDPERVTLRWPSATAADVRTLSVMLSSAAEAFLPDGSAPLGFAAGVAVASDGPDPDTRLRLASEAADLALSRGNACLTAEDALSATVAARTSATLEAAASAAERLLASPDHGSRCAALAGAVADRLGLTATDRRDLVSAARFHHVGLIASGDASGCSTESRTRSGPLLLPHLGSGAVRAVEGSVVAACDTIESARAGGESSPDELLAAVDAALAEELPVDVRDALRAVLGAAPVEGQAVSA